MYVVFLIYLKDTVSSLKFTESPSMEKQNYFSFSFSVLCTLLQYSNLREDCYGYLQVPFFILLTLLCLAAPIHVRIRWWGLIIFFPLCN